MAIFEFADAGAGTSTSVGAINFTSDGVPFTLSTTGVNSGFIASSPAINGGQLSFSNTAANVITFDAVVNGTNPNGFFNGQNLAFTVGNSYSGTWNVTFINSNGALPNLTLALTGTGQVINLGANPNVYSAIRFTPTGPGVMSVARLDATLLCYLEGTGLATPNGRVAVEDLQPGDMVLTADGRSVPVEWIGIQTVDTKMAHPAKVNPVCITAGALGENVPSRDLYVSADHAIELGGYLINANALVNGRSIYQVASMPLEGFKYFHIETQGHELLVAEDCAAESYVDFVGRDRFDNGAERADAPVIPEMEMPRISAARMVPAALRAELSDRADALGLTQPQVARSA